MLAPGMRIVEQLKAAQERDVREMQSIYAAVAAGSSPDEAVTLVIGGNIRLSGHVKEALIS